MSGQIAIRAEREPGSFLLLGAIEIVRDGQRLDPGPDREQRMLVALLSAKGSAVSHGKLAEAIWDDQPEGARDELYHLARGLRARMNAAGHQGALTAANGTYRLGVPADHVDVHRFHKEAARARDLTGHDDTLAVRVLEEAMRLHRGEPLAGLGGRWIDGYRHTLIEERRAAELALYEAAIRSGEARERIPGLSRLFQDRPDDEWVAWLYMHALYRAGRQEDALAVWHLVSRHLDETIAAASLRALANLHERMLRQADDLDGPEAVWFPVGRPVPVTGSGQHAVEGGPGGDDNAESGAAADSEDRAARGADREDESEADGQFRSSVVIHGPVNAGAGSVFGLQVNRGGVR